MNLSVTTHNVSFGGSPQPRRVRVPGRDDIGVVVDPGKNFGSVYVLGIHFPETGECLYFDRSRVQTVEE